MYCNCNTNRWWLLGFFCIIAHSVYSQAPANKPTTATQAAAPTVATAGIPDAYPGNIPVNFVRTREAMGPITSETNFNGAGFADVKEATQYLDGLGRPLQTVVRQMTPGSSPKDMVSPVFMDAFGREPLKYLPYVSTTSDGKFKANPFAEQQTFMQAQYPGEQVYYGKAFFEASPLNRIQKTMAPGNSWAGSNRGTEAEYLVNTIADAVRIWNITTDPLNYAGDNSAVNIPTAVDVYDPGELIKNVTKDEHGNVEVEYKDKQGQLILKKIQVDASMAADYSGYNGFLCTYYVYDDLSQLRFVIPPKAVAGLLVNNWQLTDALCFRYEYDDRQRMIAKKVPDAGWVYMLYDKRDRLVFSQDAKMRDLGEWMTTLYDDLNRPVATGILRYNGGREQLKIHLEGINSFISNAYTFNGSNPKRTEAFLTLNSLESGTRQAVQRIDLENGFTTNGDFTAEIVNSSVPGDSFSENVQINGNPLPNGYVFIPLTITYFDDYQWTGNTYTTQWNSKLDAGQNLHSVDMPTQASSSTKGLVTGTKVRVLEVSENWRYDGNAYDLTKGNWLQTVNFFDDRNRVIQVQSVNYKGGVDIATNRYNFTGNILTSYLTHQNPAASVNIGVRTSMNYDHAGRLLKTVKSIFRQPTDVSPAETTVVSELEYDELGRLAVKKIGQKKDDNGVYTNAPIETQKYSYNIRGWLKGVNMDYVNNTGNQVADTWFGMELNYDWGFTNNQFNGNITGTKWRSKGDGEQRAYGYSYDKTNRILHADFSQYNGNGYADNVNNLNFDAQMGNGVNWNTAYDENGNILSMKHWGLVGAASTLIDDLSYEYFDNYTNKLKKVTDNVNNVNTKLGDFRDIQQQWGQSGLYTYDKNGNLIRDTHKGLYWFDGDDKMDGIFYGHLNLPYMVKVMKTTGAQNGSIIYIYDALGNKLEKRVYEVGSSEKRKETSYIVGFNYENNKLQFLGQEEGRVRLVENTSNPQTPGRYVFDYTLKDHLGNVRAMLTDEQKIDRYPVATLEGAGSGSPVMQEKTYYDINTVYVVNKPSNVNPSGVLDYINDNGTNNPNTFGNKSATSEKVYQLNGAANKTGLSRILKVMAGDKLNILANSYYSYSGAQTTTNELSYPELINSFLGVVAGGGAASEHGITSTIMNNDPSFYFPLDQFTKGNPVNGSNNVKAGISYVILDEHFKFVSGGFDPVNSAQSGGFQPHFIQNIQIPKNGYIYIYCSNESNINVFFDNLEVVHVRGPLLEENNYYAFGLAIAGISSKALGFGGVENRKKFNDGTELNTDLDLNWYETDFRSYDPQIGRFHQIDELTEFDVDWSPYVYAHNNPILLNDPLGLSADSVGGPKPPNPFDNAKLLQEVVVTPKKSVGQPGFGESLIPIWGSGRAAVDDFQNGRWGWGIINTALAISDVFLIKSAVTAVGKLVVKGIGEVAAKEGVYVITTRSGRYVGQSKHFLKRLLQHFKKGGKLSGQYLEKTLLHEMPGSTKLEREVYEQYIIREAGGVDVLINKVNPMGGRMDKYFEMIDGVIEKFGLPR